MAAVVRLGAVRRALFTTGWTHDRRPRSSKTPLHALHLELGARMAPFAGYDMPIQYPSGVLAEHLHTRKAAGLFDVSHMGQALIEGADHARLARLSRDALPRRSSRPRARAPALHATAQRRRAASSTTSWSRARPARTGRCRLVVNAARKAVDFALIRARLPADVRLTPLAEAALIALQGPLAAPTLWRASRPARGSRPWPS